MQTNKTKYANKPNVNCQILNDYHDSENVFQDQIKAQHLPMCFGNRVVQMFYILSDI